MIDTIVNGAIGNTFALAAVTTLCLVLLGSTFLKSHSFSQFPRYEISKDGKKNQYPTLQRTLREAYSKFRNDVFQVGGLWKDTLVVPPKFVEGLKALPEHQLSFTQLNDERFSADLTLMKLDGDKNDQDTIVRSISVNLTRHLTKVMTDLDDEIRHAFSDCIPACEDWTKVYPAASLVRMVALASGRVFVGSPLNRNEDFLKCTITYTIDAFGGAEEIRKYPTPLRRLVSYWLPQLRRCRESLATMKKLMEPILKERMELIQAGKDVSDDMTTWNIQNANPHRKFDANWQAHAQLLLSMAAIHTTTMQSSHTWFDLAAHPEYVEPLREEITQVIASEPDGIIAKVSMPKLKKLDSFLKESQRMNPLGLTTFDRKVTSDLTLPDGTRLPKGTVITAATSEIARDPAFWDNPNEFDGFRFEKLRQQPGNENRYQFVTTSMDSLHFGHGKHACPGRFFAANEIKLFLVHLIMNYDIKLPEGAERPENIETMGGYRPDHEKPILLKRRTTQWI